MCSYLTHIVITSLCLTLSHTCPASSPVRPVYMYKKLLPPLDEVRLHNGPLEVPLTDIYTSPASWKCLEESTLASSQQQKAKTTAPRIPMWSPTMVLTRRYSG